MAYRFPLESVLRLRESIEKREELLLQKAQYEVAKVQQRINDVNEELEEADRKRGEALLGSVEAFRLQAMQEDIRAAKETKQTLIATIALRKDERDRRMKFYQAAHSGRRMLSDLRDQQRNVWEQEQARIEQRRLDDIYAARLQRR